MYNVIIKRDPTVVGKEITYYGRVCIECEDYKIENNMFIATEATVKYSEYNDKNKIAYTTDVLYSYYLTMSNIREMHITKD